MNKLIDIVGILVLSLFSIILTVVSIVIIIFIIIGASLENMFVSSFKENKNSKEAVG